MNSIQIFSNLQPRIYFSSNTIILISVFCYFNKCSKCKGFTKLQYYMKMIRDQRRSTRKGFVPSSIFQSFEFLDFVPETQERGRSTRVHGTVRTEQSCKPSWTVRGRTVVPLSDTFTTCGRSSFAKIKLLHFHPYICDI